MKIFIASAFILLALVIFATFIAEAKPLVPKTTVAAAAPAAADPKPTISKQDKALVQKIMKRPARRSLFAACRSEIKTYECLVNKKASKVEKKQNEAKMNSAAGRREAMRATLDCLDENQEKIGTSSACGKWIKSRSTCIADTKKDNVCPTVNDQKDPQNDDDYNMYMDTATKCLLHSDVKKLSRDCVESEYYRALNFQRFWRARRDRNVKNTAKKHAPAETAAAPADGDNNNNEEAPAN